jgi:hypothetical protein
MNHCRVVAGSLLSDNIMESYKYTGVIRDGRCQGQMTEFTIAIFLLLHIASFIFFLFTSPLIQVLQKRFKTVVPETTCRQGFIFVIQ